MTTNFRPASLVAVIAILAIAVGYFCWGVSDQIGFTTGDAPDYLIMARSYAHPGQDRVASETASTSRFPPVYPLVLARTGGADSMTMAHRVTIAFLPLALLALFAWHRRARVPVSAALLVVLAVAAVPDIWLSALSVQTEYPYLFFSLVALALLADERPEPSDALLYGAALAVVLAILTRTIGIVLLPALAPVLWRASWRQRLVTVAIVVLPLVTWYSLHHPRDGGYVSVIGSFFGADPLGAIVRVLVGQVGALRIGLTDAMLLDPPSLRPLADVLELACVAAAVVRALRLKPDGLYACAYIGMLLFYPYPEDAHRLMWPILPVLLTQVVLVARDAVRAHPERAARVAAAFAAALVLAMALPSMNHARLRHDDPLVADAPAMRADPTWYAADRREAMLASASAHALAEALHRANALVPAGDCVIANRADWVNYYADRRSISPQPPRVSDAEFESAVQASGCRFVFATPFFDRLYHERMYPLRRLEGKFEIVDQTQVPERFASGMELDFVLAKLSP